jgi:hypothetical protein
VINFKYEPNCNFFSDAGIKRWTDGYNWSPSRILGNFLIYREVHKKPTTSRKSPSGSITDVRDDMTEYTPVKRISKRKGERRLVGSLSESYGYKDDGLIKKSMSIKLNGISQHLISYYYPDEVKNGRLRTPSSVPELAELEISSDLLREENFRVPPMIEPSSDQHDLAMMPSSPPFMDKPYMIEDMRSHGYPLEHHHPQQQQRQDNLHPAQHHQHQHQHIDADQRSLPPFRSMSHGYIYPESNAINPKYSIEATTSYSSNPNRFQEDKRNIKSEYEHFTLPNVFPQTHLNPYLPSPNAIPGTVDQF